MRRSLLIIVPLLLCRLSFAQVDQPNVPDPVTIDDVAEIYHDEYRSFHCERLDLLLKYYDGLSEAEVSERLETESEALDLLLSSQKLSFLERRVIKQSGRTLEKLKHYSTKKEGLKDFRRALCHATEKLTLGTAKGIAFAANLITQMFEFPMRALGKFFRGLIKGEARPNDGELYYDVIGPQLYSSFAKNIMQDAAIKLAIAEPWLIPVLISPVINNEVMDLCAKENTLTPKQVKFCAKYKGFQKKFLSATTPFERGGAKLHQFFSKDKTPIEKSQELLEIEQKTEEELYQMFDVNLSDDEMCAKFTEINEKLKNAKFIHANYNKNAWTMATNPERFGNPDIVDFKTPSENLVQQPEKTRGSLRNVIISAGPSAELLAGQNQKKLYEDYKVLYKKFKKLVKTAQRIYRDSKTTQACEAARSKTKFKISELIETKEQMEASVIGGKLFQNKQIKRQYKQKKSFLNLFKILRLKWEFVDSGDLHTIESVLKSKDVANVIIYIHGSKLGKLIDSDRNELPPSFFSDISPSIMSISFFSCFSQKIDDFYHLSEVFNRTKTYHPMRHLSFVKYDPTYAFKSYKEGTLPIEAFGSYLKQVDQYLRLSVKGNFLAETMARADLETADEGPICQFEIEGLGQKNVTYAVYFNLQYLGSTHRGTQCETIPFSCSLIRSGRNKLLIQDINVSSNETLQVDAQVTFVDSVGIRTQLPALTPISFSDGTTQSMRIEFDESLLKSLAK